MSSKVRISGAGRAARHPGGASASFGFPFEGIALYGYRVLYKLDMVPSFSLIERLCLDIWIEPGKARATFPSDWFKSMLKMFSFMLRDIALWRRTNESYKVRRRCAGERPSECFGDLGNYNRRSIGGPNKRTSSRKLLRGA